MGALGAGLGDRVLCSRNMFSLSTWDTPHLQWVPGQNGNFSLRGRISLDSSDPPLPEILVSPHLLSRQASPQSWRHAYLPAKVASELLLLSQFFRCLRNFCFRLCPKKKCFTLPTLTDTQDSDLWRDRMDRLFEQADGICGQGMLEKGT